MNLWGVTLPIRGGGFLFPTYAESNMFYLLPRKFYDHTFNEKRRFPRFAENLSHRFSLKCFVLYMYIYLMKSCISYLYDYDNAITHLTIRRFEMSESHMYVFRMYLYIGS